MRNKFILFFALLLINILAYAGPQGSSKSAYFSLIKATKQEWISGAPGGKGGAGVNYLYYLLVKKSFSGYFSIVWVGNDFFSSASTKLNAAVPDDNYRKNDTILVKAVRYTIMPSFNKPGMAAPIHNNTDPPVPYKGASLLEYTIGTKTSYFVVKTLHKLEKVEGK